MSFQMRVELVGVVARVRHHGQDRPGARVEGHHRALALAQGLGRRPLHGHVDGQLEVGPLVGLAHDLVPVAGDPQDARLAGELLVVDPLDAGPAVPQAVVAQPGRGEAALRVLAEEVLALLAVDGQLHPVGGDDDCPAPPSSPPRWPGCWPGSTLSLGAAHTCT